MAMGRQLESFFSDANLDASVRETVRGILEHIDGGIDDVGYRRSVEILQEEGSSDYWRGRVNLIPSDSVGPCRPVVLATIRGMGRGRFGFSRVLQGLRQHLYRCKGTTKVALIISDVWDAETFDSDHAEDWSTFESEGVRLAVFVSPSDASGLSPLRLELGF